MSMDLREGDRLAPPMGAASDAALRFVGVIETPFATLADCPRRGDPDGPACTLVLDPAWGPALEGVTAGVWAQVLYWLHLSRRDLLCQDPRRDGSSIGTFALRSPVRPNPIGVAQVRILSVVGARVTVQGLDCVNGTPLLDLKPVRCPEAP